MAGGVNPTCQLCGEEINAGERHDAVPVGTADRGWSEAHRECMLREVAGGIGHHTDHQFWCVEHGDPDGGRTYRRSALEVEAWLESRALTASVSSLTGTFQHAKAVFAQQDMERELDTTRQELSDADQRAQGPDERAALAIRIADSAVAYRHSPRGEQIARDGVGATLRKLLDQWELPRSLTPPPAIRPPHSVESVEYTPICGTCYEPVQLTKADDGTFEHCTDPINEYK